MHGWVGGFKEKKRGVCLCLSKGDIRHIVHQNSSVCLPVVRGPCVCVSVSPCPVVWFSTRLNGHSVFASILRPTAALHPLPRSKCCNFCAKITGAFAQGLNPSSPPLHCTRLEVSHLWAWGSSAIDIKFTD